MSRRFTINAPAVVSEVIDGEAVIMNLQSGHYFSTRETGALVWSWIERGVSEDEAGDALARRCGASAPEVRLAVASFVSSLQAHELVRELVGELVGEQGADAAVGRAADDAGAGTLAWSAPTLLVYTDMEDLLLLDPIHDVGEAGWPMPKSPEGQAA